MIKVMMKKRIHHILGILNLSLDGRLRLCFFDEGGGLILSIPFLFVKTIEKVLRLRTVLKLFFWEVV